MNVRLPDVLLFSCIDEIHNEIISSEVYLVRTVPYNR